MAKALYTLLPLLVTLVSCCPNSDSLGRGGFEHQDFISDLGDDVIFKNSGIWGWSHPCGWSTINELKEKGYVTFTPEKHSVQHVYFGDTMIRVGRFNDQMGITDWKLCYSELFNIKNSRELMLSRKKRLRTLRGYDFQLYYFELKERDVGAIAVREDGNHVHFFAIFGRNASPENRSLTAFGTFHRLLYHYERY